MPRRSSPLPAAAWLSCLLAWLAVVLGSGAAAHDRQQQVPGAFRSRVVLVPVDVHVVDSRGRPITDLRREDFTILEGGRPQEIAHFSVQHLAPEPPAQDEGPAFRQPPGSTLTPQHQRVFLIFLARGRLQHPAMGVDGLIEFVRDRLLPQDQVAVMAWNRATGFTTDHVRALGVIERFKRGHEEIEAWFSEQDQTLAAIYGTGEIPPGIQQKIDAIFESTDRRVVLEDPLADTNALAAEQRRTIGDLMRNDLVSQRIGPELADAYDEAAPTPSAEFGLDEYLRASGQSVYDLGNLYKAVAYLRYLEGEKHLVFVSQNGLFLPSVSGRSGIAAAASDARVAIDTIQTGGRRALGLSAGE
jgi:VWFA-related protein